jgi:ribonuclease HII
MYVIGADEVGRGCLAGDVFVCAVLVPEWMEPLPGVRDSKQLSPAGRERMYGILTANTSVRWRVASRSVERINQIGINPAQREAYEEAIQALLSLGEEGRKVKVDGSPMWPSTLFPEAPTLFVPHGDASDWEIGAASILAKVTRDRYMKALAPQYPAYGFDVNFGYGTPEHLEALKTLGLTPLHRTKFCRKVELPGDREPSLIEELFG